LIFRRGRREEHHVVLDAERHKLKTPKSDHRPQPKRAVRTCHLERWRELEVFHATTPLPDAPTVGVWTVGP
jgi:hypothetical protein